MSRAVHCRAKGFTNRVLPFAVFVLGSLPAFAQGLGMHVSAASGVPAGLSKEEWKDSQQAFSTIEYRGVSAAEALEIRPCYFFRMKKKPLDYLELLRKGGPITRINASSTPNVMFPALDVKLVNNTEKTVHFSEARIKVKHSEGDLAPFPLILSDDDQVQGIDFLNDGWSDIDTLDVDFSFLPRQPKETDWKTPAYHQAFHRIREKLRIYVGDELLKAGVSEKLVALGKAYLDSENKIRELEKTLQNPDDPDPVKDKPFLQETAVFDKLTQQMGSLDPSALGIFDKGCWMFGTLKLAWSEGTEKKSMDVRFSCPVRLLPPEGLGAISPITSKHEVMLRTEGDNYELELPLSSIVKPGGVGHFLVTLGVDRSSRHELTILLRTTERQELTSGIVKIHAFLPRSAAALMAKPAPEE